ncbi:MAG TPA: hypothetical protein VNR62_04525 [Cellulomonas sp.]|nr:hypothetical protein [Cellulomonas sp.]
MTGREAISVVVLLAVLALVLWGMRAGWNHRRTRTADLVGVLPVAPAELGSAHGAPIDAVYVSTTAAGDWLDRVVAQDLGVRSPATVSVHDAGVLIARTGAPDVFIPTSTLRTAGTAPGMAGKFVGKDGLVVLTWQPDPAHERGLDTGLRPQHHADGPVLVDAVSTLIAGTHGTKEKS